jgi:hypothetical protein
MRRRSADWWDEWIRRDTTFSQSPYQQLAAAFTAVGERDKADDIRYLGRIRERQSLENWSSTIWSYFLQWVAGFGIGSYTFRVLYWAIGISFLGAIYLRSQVKNVHAQRHGLIWCFFATLSRLLPVIEIKKEFTDFFNDSERNGFTKPQDFAFSALGVVGWLFGAILIAAVSGLTGKL